jgi:flagellar biogenesis protein FliO
MAVSDPPVPAAAVAMTSALPREENDRGRMVIALVVLAACALGAVALKRRRGDAPSEDPLRIVASRSLGGRARVVLIAAGGRELLVAVNDKDARLLGRWGRGKRAGTDEADQRDESNAIDPLAALSIDVERPTAAAPSSPAIEGILRLKRQSAATAPSWRDTVPDCAGDRDEPCVADELDPVDNEWWSRELAAASRRSAS